MYPPSHAVYHCKISARRGRVAAHYTARSVTGPALGCVGIACGLGYAFCPDADEAEAVANVCVREYVPRLATLDVGGMRQHLRSERAQSNFRYLGH